MIGDNGDKFPHKLLLTNREVPNLCRVFADYLSADILSYQKLNYLRWYNQEVDSW